MAWAHPAPEDGRLHNRVTAVPDWEVIDDYPQLPPLPFAAEQPRHARRPAPRRWFPWASAGLSALGQLILAVAIAFGAIDPIPAIAVVVLWLTCSLLLIAAQTLSEWPRS